MTSDPLLHHRASAFREGEHYAVSAAGCWEWLGSRNGQGYGTLYQREGEKLAHRAVYIDAGGEIPAGFHVHHKCENKCCCNPAHLEPLSPSEHRKLHTRADSDLSWEEVREIRRVFATGATTIFELGEMYDLGKSQIHNIVNNVKWHDPEFTPGRQVQCGECGTEFVALRSNKRFCSRHCRTLWNGRRTYRRKAGLDLDTWHAWWQEPGSRRAA